MNLTTVFAYPKNLQYQRPGSTHHLGNHYDARLVTSKDTAMLLGGGELKEESMAP
jgi:hypothetical protein